MEIGFAKGDLWIQALDCLPTRTEDRRVDKGRHYSSSFITWTASKILDEMMFELCIRLLFSFFFYDKFVASTKNLYCKLTKKYLSSYSKKYILMCD